MKALPALVAVILLGVASSACDVSPNAATVNGASISQSQLNSQLSELVGKNNQAVTCALQLQGTNLPSSLAGAGSSTVNSSLASYELSNLVLDELIGQDLSHRHHPVTSSDISQATLDLEAEFDLSSQSASSSGSSSCLGQATGRQLLQHLPSSFAADQVRYLAEEEQLAVVVSHVDLSANALERYYFANSSQLAEDCLSDIEVTAQSQAQSILTAISSGSATFETEAQQNSIDAQTAPDGGVISPCLTGSQVQSSSVLASISTLGAGQISQPIQATSSTGSTVWLLIKVNSKPEIPLAQVESQIRLALLSAHGSALSKEFDKITSGAQVTVDPRYGTWTHLRGVQPPVPPSAKYLVSPSADQLPAASSALGG